MLSSDLASAFSIFSSALLSSLFLTSLSSSSRDAHLALLLVLPLTLSSSSSRSAHLLLLFTLGDDVTPPFSFFSGPDSTLTLYSIHPRLSVVFGFSLSPVFESSFVPDGNPKAESPANQPPPSFFSLVTSFFFLSSARSLVLSEDIISLSVSQAGLFAFTDEFHSLVHRSWSRFFNSSRCLFSSARFRACASSRTRFFSFSRAFSATATFMSFLFIHGHTMPREPGPSFLAELLTALSPHDR